jgi:DNA-binding MarR family transcriptional regulator
VTVPDRGTAAGRGSDDDEPGETLSEAFLSVARQLRGTSQATLAPWDITPAQLRALRVLGRRGAQRMSDLSSHLHIAARSTTEVVDALESRGLVRRLPDPGDRRATLAELTEHGASVLNAISAARGTEAERIFDRLSAADKAHLVRMLRKLRD